MHNIKNRKNLLMKVVIVLICIVILVLVFKVTVPNLKNSSINQTEADDEDIEIDWSKYTTQNYELSKSITISEAGVYNLTGIISNGLITVNAKGNVKLVLDGVSITNSNGPAIYVKDAENVVIELVDGSNNYLEDGSVYSGYDTSVIGTIYSSSDVIFQGDGVLEVISNNEDAIVGKSDLKILSGTYNITSEDDGIRGKDSVYIKDGTFTINSLGDGIKSTNDTDVNKGYVEIENGTFNIITTLDGIQAETKVLINNGIFNITTGGGSNNSNDKSSWGNWGNSSTDSDSAKGIKAGENIDITGGTYDFNTSDDSIHSNNYVDISGGSYTIFSVDDGIHADSELVINNGQIDIKKSYEGLEAQTITINDGDINIISSDDGINVAGGNDGSAMNRPGAGENISSTKSTMTINGGTIYIDSSGDGLDANGSIYINGGYINVDGPTNSGNGALDYDSECKVEGGTLIAVGSSGMAQGISNSSTQYGVLINFTNNYTSGTVINIVDSNNSELMSYTSSKSFSSIVFSSSKLEKGTYTLKVNGSIYQTFTISDISSIVGNPSRMDRGNIQDRNMGERR